MRFNIRVGPVRTQTKNTQKIPNYEMRTKNIFNSQVCSLDKRKSKGVNADEILLHVCYSEKSEPKRVINNACSSDDCWNGCPEIGTQQQ